MTTFFVVLAAVLIMEHSSFATLGTGTLLDIYDAVYFTLIKECKVGKHDTEPPECNRLRSAIKELKTSLGEVLEKRECREISEPSGADTFVRALKEIDGYTSTSILEMVNCVDAHTQGKNNPCSKMQPQDKLPKETYAVENSECTVVEAETRKSVLIGIEVDANCNVLIRLPNSFLGSGSFKSYHRLFAAKNWESIASADGLMKKRELANIQHVMTSVEKDPSLQEGIIKTIMVSANKAWQEFFREKDLRWFLSLRKNLEKMQESKSWLKIGKDLSQGLANLHKMGFVHSDIKTGNALAMNPTDPKRARAVYTDLGASFLTPCTQVEGGFSVQTRVRGTPRYLAPEQFSEGPIVRETCEEARLAAQKRDVYSHALALIRLKHGIDSLPWEKDCLKIDLRCEESIKRLFRLSKKKSGVKEILWTSSWVKVLTLI